LSRADLETPTPIRPLSPAGGLPGMHRTQSAKTKCLYLSFFFVGRNVGRNGKIGNSLAISMVDGGDTSPPTEREPQQQSGQQQARNNGRDELPQTHAMRDAIRERASIRFSA